MKNRRVTSVYTLKTKTSRTESDFDRSAANKVTSHLDEEGEETSVCSFPVYRRSLFTKTYVFLAFFVSWHASAKKKKRHGSIFRSSREKTIEFCDEKNRRGLTRFNDRTDSYSRDIRNW